MSLGVVPCNIKSYVAAIAEGLRYGDKVRIVSVGNYTEDGVFLQFLRPTGLQIALGGVHGQRVLFVWGVNSKELWLLEEKPNIYYSDVPEVSDVLKKLKEAVQKHVQADDCAGVLYLLDYVHEVKKAEQLFREARKIVAVASIQS